MSQYKKSIGKEHKESTDKSTLLESKTPAASRQAKPLQKAEYLALAEFRYQVRRYLRHMEETCRETGISPQQYQVILAIKGLPMAQQPNIGSLAERMQLNHNSMVELVDRCEQHGLIRRTRSGADRRQVELEVTAEGDAILRRLASAARQELQNRGPILVESVMQMLRDSGTAVKGSRKARERAGGKEKSGP